MFLPFPLSVKKRKNGSGTMLFLWRLKTSTAENAGANGKNLFIPMTKRLLQNSKRKTKRKSVSGNIFSMNSAANGKTLKITQTSGE